VVQLPGEPELLLPPAVVRRNDTSASSINEWTGAGGGGLACAATTCMAMRCTQWHVLAVAAREPQATVRAPN
jgi:hypothetical protein